MLDNMHELERAEAQVFVELNGLPQPDWMRKFGIGLEFLATGGRMWIVGALLAALLRAPNSRQAVLLGCPIVALVAFSIERGAKPLLVRLRSFRHAVAMMLLGVRGVDATVASSRRRDAKTRTLLARVSYLLEMGMPPLDIRVELLESCRRGGAAFAHSEEARRIWKAPSTPSA